MMRAKGTPDETAALERCVMPEPKWPTPDAVEPRVRAHVAALAQSPRVPGTATHRAAADYIGAHLQNAGWTVEPQACAAPGVRGANLIARRTASLESSVPRLIIGAHYDSVPGTPGADDNASGVAALLEVARWLAEGLSLVPGALQLVAYDLEEYGLEGSRAHVGTLRRAAAPLQGMISLEMLGYTDHRAGSQQLPAHLADSYPDVGNFIGICGNEASSALLRAAVVSMRAMPGLPVEFILVPENGEALPPVRFSDHSSFWDAGYPALMITDTSFFRNPHYHRPSDTPDTLDYAFLACVTAGVCHAVTALLTAP